MLFTTQKRELSRNRYVFKARFQLFKVRLQFEYVTNLKFKADFQSVLGTFESSFTTFVLLHVRRHKM